MMTEHKLDSKMTRQQILDELVSVEREARALLEQAARLVPDPEERVLFERLAGREAATLRELLAEEDRVAAEAFVQRAMDV